jgi:hypothetical protein
MKALVIRWLRLLLAWLETPVYAAAVKALVTEVASLEVSGERKRSHVLHRLREQFPHVATRDLALAIEWVIQESK